ncbi:MAG: hypothetical protein ACFB50_04795 [Rubrobacteraceae bacterium]
MESEGTPSDSARNRAERAEEEVVSGLAGLRASFEKSVGTREGQLAFDHEFEVLYPDLKLSGSTS